MSVPNTKHLRKQKNKWMFRIKIPSDVQFAYDNKAVYYKTTGAPLEDIAAAIRKRDLFLAEFNLEVADIRKRLSSGDLRTAAQILEEQNKINIDKVRPKPNEEDSLFQEAKKDAVEDALSFVSLDEKEKANPDVVDAILKSDKTGKAKGYIDSVLGNSFDSHLDGYKKFRDRNMISLKTIDENISHIKSFTNFHSTLDGITTSSVSRFKNHLYDNENISSPSIRKYLVSLAGYWEYLNIEVGVKQAEFGNPFKGHKLPPHSPNERLVWSAQYFSDEQDDVKVLLENETSHLRNNPHLKHVIIFGMFTGCRLEEIGALKKHDVKYEENIRCIYIAKSKTDKKHKFGRRFVPIHPSYEPMVDMLIKETEGDYLFNLTPDKYGHRTKSLSSLFQDHKQKCGFPTKKVKKYKGRIETSSKDFHSFRTTLNTFFASIEINALKRSMLCGWKERNTSMAEDDYLRMNKIYKMHERKGDILKISQLYPWFNSSYFEN